MNRLCLTHAENHQLLNINIMLAHTIKHQSLADGMCFSEDKHAYMGGLPSLYSVFKGQVLIVLLHI